MKGTLYLGEHVFQVAPYAKTQLYLVPGEAPRQE